MAHYKGYTIVICMCSFDKDWQWIVKKNIFYTLRDFASFETDDMKVEIDNQTKEEAFEKAKTYIDNLDLNQSCG